MPWRFSDISTPVQILLLHHGRSRTSVDCCRCFRGRGAREGGDHGDGRTLRAYFDRGGWRPAILFSTTPTRSDTHTHTLARGHFVYTHTHTHIRRRELICTRLASVYSRVLGSPYVIFTQVP